MRRTYVSPDTITLRAPCDRKSVQAAIGELGVLLLRVTAALGEPDYLDRIDALLEESGAILVAERV